MSGDIDYLSAWSYASGNDAVKVAEGAVVTLLDAHRNLVDNRSPGLPALAPWTDLTHSALARKVIGRLMDAGWRPPTSDEIQSATRHFVEPCDCGHGRRDHVGYGDGTGECEAAGCECAVYAERGWE